MNLKSLRKLLAIALLVVAGHGWATVSEPQHDTQKWNAISGIVWSTDNGSTWGNSALEVGQSVAFKFTLFKEYDGKHYADFIKTWIDWDGDEQFSSAETLFFGSNVVNGSYTANTGPGDIVNWSRDFTSAPLTLTNAMLGDHFLLARVTCSESLLTTAGVSGPWSKQWDSVYKSNDNDGYNQLFSPTAPYVQGQYKLVALTVDGQQVPEPGTLALFAVAVVGLGFQRRATRV